MAKIAIMGFGAVGSGVLEVCRRNAASIARRAGEPVEVKYILDVRDFSDSPDAALFVKDINVILNDPEVKVVVETIGGTRFAYPYVRQCLESGRSVCTSNKEMVATYGAAWVAVPHHYSHAPVPCRKPDQPDPGHCERNHQLYADQDEARKHGL